ncbi:hypothetical protein B9Z55_008950 [Caenorhabditis nigoni]|uniref:Uncharacterized protein n=1 Tax=Caenorhabditis nigoni TaxID=1611254 RepID=A0A2G5UQD9_9PELO|nr:hypothetical protein B9Z55_008950 [Caenorhabditis nigoni]
MRKLRKCANTNYASMTLEMRKLPNLANTKLASTRVMCKLHRNRANSTRNASATHLKVRRTKHQECVNDTRNAPAPKMRQHQGYASSESAPTLSVHQNTRNASMRLEMRQHRKSVNTTNAQAPKTNTNYASMPLAGYTKIARTTLQMRQHLKCVNTEIAQRTQEMRQCHNKCAIAKLCWRIFCAGAFMVHCIVTTSYGV